MSKVYTKEEVEKIKLEEWRKGYDLGCKNTVRQNDTSIKLGQAILGVLDGRYAFPE